MNVFRLSGDLSHLLAILLLLVKIWKTRSCAGNFFFFFNKQLSPSFGRRNDRVTCFLHRPSLVAHFLPSVQFDCFKNNQKRTSLGTFDFKIGRIAVLLRQENILDFMYARPGNRGFLSLIAYRSLKRRTVAIRND